MNDTHFLLSALTEARIRETLGERLYRQALQLYQRGVVAARYRTEGGITGIIEDDETGTPVTSKAWVGDERLYVMCSCPEGQYGLCAHMGALFIAWIREPRTFIPMEPEGAISSSLSISFLSPEATEQRLRDTLQEAFEAQTIQQLRAIARRHGLPIKGRRKAPLVEALAEHLSRPQVIAQTYEQLEDAPRKVLDILALVSDVADYSEEEVAALLEQIGEPLIAAGAGHHLQTLQTWGLVLSHKEGGNRYYVVLPTAVYFLPPTPHLLRPYTGSLKGLRIEHSPPFALARTLYLVWRLVRERQLVARPPMERLPIEDQVPALQGWLNLRSEVKALSRAPGMASWHASQRSFTVPPPPYPLQDEEMQALARATGASVEAIEFIIALMSALGFITLQPGQPIETNPQVMERFLSLGPSEQTYLLTVAWEELTHWSEIYLVLRHLNHLELRRSGRYFHFHLTHLLQELADVRFFLLSLLRRLPEETWYGLDHLLAFVRKLDDHYLHRYGDPNAWWLASRITHKRYAPDNRRDWSNTYGAFIAAMLEGPLNWLGIVSLGYDKRGIVAFQITEFGAFLLGRRPSPALEKKPEGPALVLTEDGQATLDPGRSDIRLLDLLATMGALVEAGSGRLHYRLTAEGARQAFEAGHTLEEILDLLEKGSQAPLPGGLREMLTRWWENFGLVHLYPNLTILELSDDFAIRELVAATSLAQHIIYQFSPRLVAIEPDAVDDLVRELQEKGYTPRVAESFEEADDG